VGDRIDVKVEAHKIATTCYPDAFTGVGESDATVEAVASLIVRAKAEALEEVVTGILKRKSALVSVAELERRAAEHRAKGGK